MPTVRPPLRRNPGRAPSMGADERRAAIIETTQRLLVDRGEMVTTRQIAEAAGIAEGTVFRVFADKDEVIAAAVDAALDPAALDASVARIDAGLTFEERLVVASTLLQQRVVDLWRLLSGVGARFHEQARRPLADSSALVALFEPEHQRLRIEPVAAARLLRAVTLAATHPLLTVEPLSPEEIVDVFLHGAAKRAPSC